MLGICLKLGLFAVSPFIKDMQLNVRKSTLWKEFQISWNSHQAGKNIKQILVQISSLLFSQLITNWLRTVRCGLLLLVEKRGIDRGEDHEQRWESVDKDSRRPNAPFAASSPPNGRLPAITGLPSPYFQRQRQRQRQRQSPKTKA